MKKLVNLVILLMSFAITSEAQIQIDTLTTQIRSYVARNFAEARTFNLYWQTMPSHDYTLQRNGSNYEKGQFRDIHNIQFSGTVPIVDHSRFSLYANWQTNFYLFETRNDVNDDLSSLFFEDEDGYSYHEGTIVATYKRKLFGKPFILNTNLSGDGWNNGFEEISATFSAIMILKRSPITNFGIGVYAMTLYNEVPALPIISYWHKFNSHLSIDIAIPSRTYLRYNYNNHRLSVGARLESEQFYFKPDLDYLPKTSFFSKMTFKPEVVYEYIIDEHFYLIARAGVSAVIRGGIYGTGRKGIDGEPFIKVKHPMTPFFNLGISYNLFKDRD